MTPPSTPARSPISDRILAALGLAALALALLPVLGNGLVWDDVPLVAQNPRLGNPAWLWRSLTVPFWDNSSHLGVAYFDFWRPVTTAILWLGGLWDRPAIHHSISLAAAAGAGAALYALMRRLAPSPGDRPIAAWLSLIFLVHPLAAEVVCMVANMADHLSLAFALLEITLLCDVLRGRDARPRLPAAAALGLLACGSKEIGILTAGAPIAAWLLLVSAGEEIPARRLARIPTWIATIAPVALYLVLRWQVISSVDRPWVHSFSPALAAEGIAIGWGQTLLRAIVPFPTGAHAYVDPGSPWPWVLTAAAWLALAALVWVAWIRRRRPSLAAIGALLALVAVAPSLVTVRWMDDVIAIPTRYFHVPLAGLLLAALPRARTMWRRGLRLALPILAALLSMLSWMRVDEWSDEIAFYSAETHYHPESAPDLLNLAQVLVNSGSVAAAEGAVERFEAGSGRRSPTYRAIALSTRAKIAVLRSGDFDAATRLARRAIALEPSDLSYVLDLASIRAMAGHPEDSVAVLTEALESPSLDRRKKAIAARARAMYAARIARERAAAEADAPDAGPEAGP